MESWLSIAMNILSKLICGKRKRHFVQHVHNHLSNQTCTSLQLGQSLCFCLYIYYYRQIPLGIGKSLIRLCVHSLISTFPVRKCWKGQFYVPKSPICIARSSKTIVWMSSSIDCQVALINQQFFLALNIFQDCTKVMICFQGTLQCQTMLC